MPTDVLLETMTGFWGLVVLFLLVLGDAFLVIIPGEIAVSSMGALAVATGNPPLWAVVAVSATAAALGDMLCYGLGRVVGIERWAWMRRGRVRRALEWARDRLDGGTAVVLFTARFIPFARLAINLVAGATAVPVARYGGLVLLAATGWAVYQAAVGAVVAAIVPGGPVVAILASIVVAIALGALIDLVLRRRGSSAGDTSRRSGE